MRNNRFNGLIIGFKSGARIIANNSFNFGGRCFCFTANLFYLDSGNSVFNMGNREIEFMHFAIKVGRKTVKQICRFVKSNVAVNSGNKVFFIITDFNGVAIFNFGTGNIGIIRRIPIQSAGRIVISNISVNRIETFFNGGVYKTDSGAHGVDEHGGKFQCDGIENNFKFIGVGSFAVAAIFGNHGFEVCVMVVETDGINNSAGVFKCVEGGVVFAIIVVGSSAVGYNNKNFLSGRVG